MMNGLKDSFSNDFYVRWDEKQPVFVLGGGSNVLFTSDFAGTVALMAMRGIEIVARDSESVVVRVAAGEPGQKCRENTTDELKL